MIGYISGDILARNTQSLLILVTGQGIGYEVRVSQTLLSHTYTQDTITLFIYQHITEKDMQLFGFETLREKEFFMQLLKVSGLGPKGALALLDLGTSSIHMALLSGDDTVLSQASGIGPKLAKKIIVELKGKIPESHEETTTHPSSVHSNQSIIDGLIALGYEKKDIQHVLAQLPEELQTIEEKTRYCIEQLAAARM